MPACYWTETYLNGVAGYKVQSNVSGYKDNWIFLPKAGMRDGTTLSGKGSNATYWSSNYNKTYPRTAYAYCLPFANVGASSRYSAEILSHEKDIHDAVNSVGGHELAGGTPFQDTAVLNPERNLIICLQLLHIGRILVGPLNDLLYLSIGRMATYITEQQFLIDKTTLYPYSTSSGF